MYSVDTNVFLDWWERRYPRDIFPALEASLQRIANTKLFACERVYDEIQAVGSPGLKAWARGNRRLFVPHDPAIQAEANAIQTRFPGLIDSTAIHDEADRYVIALARLRGFAVVTHETSARLKRRPPRSHYIPDVCSETSVPCIDLLTLMRREGWRY